MCSDLRKGGFGGFETFPYMSRPSDEVGDPISESEKTTKTTFSQVRARFWVVLRKRLLDRRSGINA